MRKYWTVFKISWARELEYRTDFFMWRLRSIIILLVLYFLWTSLTALSGKFAGYSDAELVTYVFLANIMRAFIFGGQSRLVAQEINNGTFSMYLVKPMNHFWYVFFRELAQRLLYGVTSILEVAIFMAIVDAQFAGIFGINAFLFSIAFLFSLALYFILSYSMSILAFWTRETMGPRFLFEWIMELASGSFFPLSIFARAIFLSLHALPFFYLIYFPLEIYLGRADASYAFFGFGMQFFWIIIFGIAARVIWKNGLLKFTGEGI